jgi:arylamine N-acetyltransferase
MRATASSARRAEAEAALAARGVGVADYLARLGLDGIGPPSAGALGDRQARHLERVVFENLEIQRGRPTTVEYAESAERIVKRGRGGYCFHLNALEPSSVYAGGWRLLQGEGDGVVDVDTEQPPADEIAAAHEHLSTSPESRFVRTATFQRRHARGVDILRARTLSRVERDATRTTLIAGEDEWFATLADVFGLDLPDVDAPERRALWERVRAQHEAWVASVAG